MPVAQALKDFETSSAESLQWFRDEIASLRTGRVTPIMVNNIPIDHYGTKTPLQGLASVSNVDARTLQVSPWDETALPAIEQALTKAQVGSRPNVDGKIIRLAFPLLSEEMRLETIKVLHQKAEEVRVRFRKARDESLSALNSEKKKGDLSEDDFYRGKKELDQHIDEKNKEVENLVKSKEEEIGTL